MKKKLILIAAICLGLLTVISCGTFSDTEYAVVSEGNISADGFIYDKYENSTIRITGIKKMPALLIIPTEIDGMEVVEIADRAFADSELLLYLEFPAKSLKLGEGIFSGCYSLVAANLSDSVTCLPKGSFEDCVELCVVDGTEALTEIGEQAFAGCTSLSSFVADKLTSIGDEAFRACASLSKLVLPSTLTHIGSSAFWDCEGLVEVYADCNAEIPELAFLNCSALARVKLGDRVTGIGNEAFRGCSVLGSIEIGKKVKYIGEYAFYGCDSVTEVIFKGNKTKIVISEGNEALATGGAK